MNLWLTLAHLYEDDKFEEVKREDENWNIETKSRAQDLLGYVI